MKNLGKFTLGLLIIGLMFTSCEKSEMLVKEEVTPVDSTGGIIIEEWDETEDITIVVEF